MNRSKYDISPIERAVIEVLAYYHIFRHPLKIREIALRVKTSSLITSSIDETLDDLVLSGTIKESDGYYFLKDSKFIVQRRKEGEIRAKKLLKVAKRMSKIIYCFPFVRAVFISGSLSKGAVPEDADIDYFIITKKHRLWIARTSLVIFKRVFLLNSKKYFCTNYFIDEETLQIPDKNIFTATEVSTLIPLRGHDYYEQFIEANEWYKEFYPNVILPIKEYCKPSLLKRFSKTILEPLFYHRLAEKLDKFFMKKTYERWTKMYGQGYSDKEFELAFRSHRGTSKNHDKNFQKRVLSKVQENIDEAISSINTEPIHG
ncbi:hypothetical protein [Roseivirga sp. E12]|uniref:hypothetical protein n=1 Tax=Roseivirga sp. E12 TaxID=2819237 RepID=UPI001ABD4838|nr:hypothetical protein [Roseivirga sp. E12]MBO3699317.1 hypothetical protein [Roseivirga sp. E12]